MKISKEKTPNQESYMTVQDNGTKAMKNEHANEQFDLEGAVIKTELKCEIGDDSESVVWNRISAANQVLYVLAERPGFARPSARSYRCLYIVICLRYD